MKVVVAIDSFKGSLSSLQAGNGVKEAILRLREDAQVVVKPLAEACNAHGIDAFFPVLRTVTTLEEALDTQNAYKNLVATAYQVFRLLL